LSSTYVPLLTRDQVDALPARAREVVEYRKSGLSLNHVQGCPLDCAYCIRHTYGVWDMNQPRALCTDAQAVEQLVTHPYFQPHVTPIQLFNRATEPFLPRVKNHLFAVLENLASRGLTNHVLIITRYRLETEDCDRLNTIKHLKITLLFTYSGIDDERIEPFDSRHAETSLRLAASRALNYRTVLYWRPLVPGLNDSPEKIAHAVELSRAAHATVFTGLFYRGEIAEYYKANNIPEPYDETARRKIVPETLEARVLEAFTTGDGGALFRKTSCAVSYAHHVPDYNGHYGIGPELCDICPLAQLELCRSAHEIPTPESVRRVAAAAPGLPDFEIDEITQRAVTVTGLDEQPRYYLQHALGFQFHDSRHPHNPHRHGRAEIGWGGPTTSSVGAS
jgi:DNA repair photolyase